MCFAYLTLTSNNLEKTYIYKPFQNTLRLGRTYLLIDYIFLDKQERVNFFNNKHEYIIEQVYYTGEKIKVTPLAFIAKALVSALKEFPNFNASIDVNSNKITYKKYFHIGFAVDTPHGLMVPKIRNVNEMSIQKIGEELKNTSKLCRELKIDKKEFFGGSMTISSLGGIGGTHFTPIINPPEVAILGVGKNFDRLVKENGKIVSRKILPISLSYDHRIIDGAEGARFCVYLGKCLGKDFAFKLAV